jgi:hypothetical protein
MTMSHSRRSDRRALRAIEQDLSAAEPRLAGMFLTFTRVNRDESLPRIERVRNRPIRRAWRRFCAFMTEGYHRPEPIGAGLPRLGPPGSR